MGNYLFAGTAGFIASRVCELLLMDRDTVTGIENLNETYDVRIMDWCLNRQQTQSGFTAAAQETC